MTEDIKITIPLKLLQEAHACMLASGWRDATLNATSEDGVIENAVSQIEGQIRDALEDALAPPPIHHHRATPPHHGEAAMSNPHDIIHALTEALTKARVHVDASAKAASMVDGFGPRKMRAADYLLMEIDQALALVEPPCNIRPPIASPDHPAWQGLKLAQRQRLAVAVGHLMRTGRLCRINIKTAGEVSTPQASADVRQIMARLPGLMTYDKSRKCYILREGKNE